MRWHHILILAGALTTATAGARTIVSDTIRTNQTWSDTVLVTNDLIIKATLTILPGTVVQFDTVQDSSQVINNDLSHIGLIIRAGGAISAVGTAQDSIRFTTAAPVPVGGRWGEIDLEENLDTLHTAFKFCVFTCANNALDFRSSNHTVVQVKGNIPVEDCNIHTMARSGIYVTSGGSPQILRCRIHDLPSGGLFLHGSATVRVSYTYIYNVSVGIISPSMPAWFQKCIANHIVISNCRTALTDTPREWTGFGIWCYGGGAGCGITLQNSVVSNTDSTGIKFNGTWSFTKSYNCWWQTGDEPISGGAAVGTNSIENDPLFTDAAHGDFSLQALSPCRGTGQTGTDMGVWQSSIGVNDHVAAAAAAPGVTAGPNPGAEAVTFRWDAAMPGATLTIHTSDGKQVREYRMTGEHTIVWDRLDNSGRRAEPGLYLYRLSADGQVRSGRVMLAR
jgi:hypothetical protein